MTRWLGLATGLLLPGQAWADMGNIGDGFIYTLVAIGLLGLLAWTLVPWLVYRSLRGRGTALRVLVAVLVWTMPAWALLGAGAFAAFEQRPRAPEVVERSTAPQTLLDLEFPAGSRLEYAHDGSYGRRLVGAWAQTERDFSGLKILGLRLASTASESRLQVQLSRAQLIDGWLCGTEEQVGLQFIQSSYGLSHCILAGQAVGEVHWPAGTRVRFDGQAWALVASTVTGLDAAQRCERPIVIGTGRYIQVMAQVDLEGRQVTATAGVHCK
ncbi:hypothetical protein [Inhella proteolytica]|uniref:Uncharacterized protein n=1 Tax=Inhella proteolytica TaxID=2795029 RepID=A0A931J3B3_9BURK|nr:hypothetical protein [Inhella proteolytica]MBH9576973.1 hypothetical protein [Inhella proteolytica]